MRGAVVFLAANGNPEVWLPLRPLWWGLVLDSLVYGTAILAGWTVIAQCRSWLRVRRRRCAHCGYDRTGITSEAACPECGKAIRQRTQAAPAGRPPAAPRDPL